MENLQEILEKIIKNYQNKEINQIIATVTSAPPNLKIKFAENEIPSKQIYCSNYLLPHYHRNYTFDGIIDSMHQDVSEVKTTYNSSDMTLAGSGPHKHNLISSDGKGAIESTGNYNHHGDLWLEDTLEVGDEVLVNIVGIFYVVVSKITRMPSKAIEGV